MIKGRFSDHFIIPKGLLRTTRSRPLMFIIDGIYIRGVLVIHRWDSPRGQVLFSHGVTEDTELGTENRFYPHSGRGKNKKN